MTCNQIKKSLPWLGDKTEQENRIILSHLETCSSCRELEAEYRETVNIIKARKPVPIPRGLEKACIRRVEGERNESPFSRYQWLPRPVFQGAVVLLVFLAGIGFGKMLFQPPSWLGRYQRIVARRAGDPVTGERMLRNYFLTVQTLFLDITNMENSAQLDPDEWKAEREIIGEIVLRTREIKSMARENNPDLYRLVSEIESVLEEARGTSDSELVEVPGQIKQHIEEQGLLLKIQDFVS